MDIEIRRNRDDLEEAADNHIRKVVDAAGHPGWEWETRDIKDAFIAGAKWQREQMMKEAVGAEISYWNQTGLSILPDKSLERLGYNESARVRIIIVKEDEK